jgi:hypothetical protein
VDVEPLLHRKLYPGIPPLTTGERVKGIFAQVNCEVGNEMTGFDFTLILTEAEF